MRIAEHATQNTLAPAILLHRTPSPAYTGRMSSLRLYLSMLVIVSTLRGYAGEPSAGSARLPLHTLTNRFEMTVVSETNGIVVWAGPGADLRFFDQSRRLEFNGDLLWLNGAITTNGTGQRMIATADVDTVLVPLLRPHEPVLDVPPFRVVLDPGHGGNDPGAIVTNAPPEKALNLDIARRVRRHLKAADITVCMTRASDRTVTLEERTAFARKRRATILVSIHANKAPNSSAQGIETFVLPAAGFPPTASSLPDGAIHPGNRYDALSTQLAWFIHSATKARTKAADRGVKRARFEVLRNAPCPAVLVETGFMSNDDERRKLLSPAYRERLAKGIANGILRFRQQHQMPPPPCTLTGPAGNGAVSPDPDT